MEDYEMITRLGGGSFADVYKAREKSTGDLVAIKILKKKYSKWEDCLELREVKSLQKLHSDAISYQKGQESIIKLKQIIFIKESGTLNLVFEYMERDLFELMKSNSPKHLSEDKIRSITYQTLLGLAYMHKYGFFHRDMKPENLLCVGENIKIADFGLAREIRSVPPYTEYVSTRYYRAPECILKSTNYNSPVDIWGLGCIMAEMYLHPQPLFFGNNEKEVLFKICSILGTPNHYTWNEGLQMAKMINIKFPNFNGVELDSIIHDASSDAIDLMKQMLQWDPNKRATAQNLLNHPFFTNYPMTKQLSSFGNSSIVRESRKNTNRSSIDKMLNDTEGFDKLINKLKREKREEDVAIEKERKKFDYGISSQLNDLIIDEKMESNDNNNNNNNNYNNNKSNIRTYSNKNNNMNYNRREIPYSSPNFNVRKEENISPKRKFNNDSDPLDFDTNVILNPNLNNNNGNRKRSARKFLEETENKMNNPISVGNKFQFNNDGFTNISSIPLQQPIIMKNDYNVRRHMGNNYNNNNLFSNNDNGGMMIGDNFNRRNNESNNNNNNNGILFGMQSRRGHINNNQAKNFEFKI